MPKTLASFIAQTSNQREQREQPTSDAGALPRCVDVDPCSNHPRVVVVDDDRDITAAASARLRAAGYEPLAAYDGNEAVEIVSQSHPDLVLMDMRMPQMDGIEAIGQLRQRAETRDIPIVMLSASIADQQRALDAGARFFLTKPYRGSQMISAVEAALEEVTVSAPATVSQ